MTRDVAPPPEPVEDPPPSARKVELLELAYRYVLEHGLTGLSLRPLTTAVGSTPGVMLYLFGSKDGLVRALLARARADELALLHRLRERVAAARGAGEEGDAALAGPDAGLAGVAGQVWGWLAAREHRGLLTLWLEGYARSLLEPDGPWAGFARSTVEDWLDVLAEAQPPDLRDTEAGATQRTFVLAVLRGAMLDLLATGDLDRIGTVVRQQLTLLPTVASAG